MPIRRLHLHIRGRVQGVFFRATTHETATRLGLTGWVRNCSDGHVEIVAEGPEPALRELLEWCRHGPPAAKVTDVESYWDTATGEFPTFTVR